MGSTPVCQITAAGCVRPTFADCLAYVQGSYRAIYGQDMVLDASSQDGQFMALLANAIHDANGETLAAYNSFSPSTAQGVGLDRVVKINNIRRKRATYSTAPLRVVGQAGITITGGIVTDPAGNQWALPASVLIPDAGEITVAITCQTIGSVVLSAGGIDTANGKGSIATVTRGWQACNTTASASVGQPVETDSGLRQRQAISTAIPSQTLVDGLKGALAAITGVTRLKVYENDQGFTDVNGIPGGCLAIVLDGGDPSVIAQVIQRKKGPGVSTYGTTTRTVTSTSGIPKDVAFFYLTQVPVSFALDVTNLGGFTESIQAQIGASLAAFTNGLDIGEDVNFDQAWAAAKLYDGAGSKTYRLNSLTIGRVGSVLTSSDVPMLFTEAASGDASNVAFAVHPLA